MWDVTTGDKVCRSHIYFAPGFFLVIGLYVPSLVEVMGFLVMVGVVYFVRSKLLPEGEPDTRTRKLLILAGVLAVVLVVTVPFSLDGGLFRMTELTLRLLF